MVSQDFECMSLVTVSQGAVTCTGQQHAVAHGYLYSNWASLHLLARIHLPYVICTQLALAVSS